MLSDKVRKALKTIRQYEPPEGYFLGFSGGKDSVVLLDLTKRAKVKFDAHYNITTIEHPETLEFLKNFPEVEIAEPKATISELIIKKGFPPLRTIRYCTTELKSKINRNRVKLLGVRAAESPKRAKQEPIITEGKDRHIFPIFDWLEKDIWEYIGKRNLKYHPLYDEGYKRIGCVLCPFSPKKIVEREFAAYPEKIEEYKQACLKAYDAQIAKGKVYRDINNGEDLFNWWKKTLLREP